MTARVSTDSGVILSEAKDLARFLASLGMTQRWLTASSSTRFGENEYVLCLSDGGVPESLEPRKLYRVMPDRDALREGLLRVIDESGEDYLYPRTLFAEIPLPKAITERLRTS